MPKLDEKIYLEGFHAYIEAKNNPNNPGRKLDSHMDSYYKSRINHPHWQPLALTHFSVQGVEKQFGSVDSTNPEHKKSFIAHVNYYKNGQLSGDYQTDLSILRLCREEAAKINIGNIIGKIGDGAAVLTSSIPHPAAQTFNIAWAIGGDDVKTILKGDPTKKLSQTSAEFIKIHGGNEEALSSFMAEFSIADEGVQKALWSQSLKNQGLSAKESDELSAKIVASIQKQLTEQVNDRSKTKEDLHTAVSNELAEHADKLENSIEDIKKQLSELSDGLIKNTATAETLKHTKQKFEYNDSEIKGLTSCAQFLSAVASFTKSKELNTLAKFTHGVAGIADALNNLEKLKTLSKFSETALASSGLTSVGPLALAGGYAAVGFAALTVVSSFMDSGPSADEVILEFLVELAHFIADEFKKVHEKLDTIHKDMLTGFETVLDACKKIYELQQETLKAIQAVSKQITDLKSLLILKLDQINTEIHVLQDLVQSGLETISEADFARTLRQLDDSIRVPNDHCENNSVQSLMNTLVSDHIIRNSPIDFYTGAFYFDSSVFVQLTANIDSDFFSFSRTIDNAYVENEQRYNQAVRINRLLNNHDLTSLLGFFAAYAEAILIDHYKPYEQIQSEIEQFRLHISKTQSNIDDKRQRIKKLEIKGLSELEISQLTQEKLNLERLEKSLALKIQALERLSKLSTQAKEIKEKDLAFDESVKLQLLEAEERKILLGEELENENIHLKTLEIELKQACPGLNFLYHNKTKLPLLSYSIAVFKDFYQKFIADICNQEITPIDIHSIKSKLGLSVSETNEVSFSDDCDGNSDSTIQTPLAYTKAIDFIAQFYFQLKKIDAIRFAQQLTAQKSRQLESSLKLAKNHLQKPLTDHLVFNPKLWAMATHKYLSVLQHPKLGSCYSDFDLYHVQQLIVMGENYLHFKKALQSQPQLYSILWRNYASTLIYIHRHFKSGWNQYFRSLDLSDAELLSREIIINPDLVLDQEVEYAKEKQNSAEFERLLEILTAQKKLLLSFYKLISANNKVIEIINNLWDKDDLTRQLHSFTQKERSQARFSTMEVFNYLNLVYARIKKYQSNTDIPNTDYIEFATVSKLVYQLDYYSSKVSSTLQLAAYDSALQASLKFVSNQEPYFDSSPLEETPMKTQFECIVNSALENANMKATDSAALVVGQTRGGKTSFIAYIIGCKMSFKDIGGTDEVLLASECPNGETPIIGNDFASKTVFPKGFTYEGTTFIDFPGLEDTRSSDTGLLGVIATQVAIKTIQSIKHIVVIIDYADIKNKNAKTLAKIAAAMSDIFKDFKAHRDSITMVITKIQSRGSEPIDNDKKQRIIHDLKQFNNAVKAGNYLSDIPNPQLMHDFLEIFLNSKTNGNNIILSYPLTSTAKEQLRARTSAGKPFPPSALNYIGDESHKNLFLKKIQGSLIDAVTVLSRLLAKPTQESGIKSNIEQNKKSISELNTTITNLEKAPAQSMQPIPYTEQDFQDKNSAKTNLVVEISGLIATREVKKAQLKKLNDNKSESQDTISWNEEDNFKGNSGVMVVREKLLERIRNSPFYEYQISYDQDCSAALKQQDCCVLMRGALCQQWCTLTSLKNGLYSGCNNVIPWQDCGFHKTSRSGTKGYISNELIDKDNGNYSVKYFTPENCYGKISVTFHVAFQKQPAVINEIKELTKDIAEIETEISEENAKLAELTSALSDMENDNHAVKVNNQNAQQHTEQIHTQLSAKRTQLSNLVSEKTKNENSLTTLLRTYDNDLQIYCEKHNFWQNLVSLDKILDFGLNEYSSFTQKFSKASTIISLHDCKDGSTELQCDELFHQGPQEPGIFTDNLADCSGPLCTFGAQAAPELHFDMKSPISQIDLITNQEINPPLKSDSVTITTLEFTAQGHHKIPYFDYGTFDPQIMRHPQTGAPLFTYYVYRDNKDVGSMVLYNHPILCRSEDGTRSNIIARTGELKDFNFKTSELKDICESLPPTISEISIESAKNGAQHGALLGMTDILGSALQANNVSPKASQCIQQASYYIAYFLLQCHLHLKQTESQNNVNMFQIIIHAALSTGSLLMTNMILVNLSAMAHQAATQSRSSLGKRAFTFFGDHINKATYIHSATQQGVIPTVSSIVAGSMARKAVSSIGVVF